MEMRDGSREWEAKSGMERDVEGGCCWGGGGGGGGGGETDLLQQQEALIRHLCERKARLQRMNRCLAAALLLLLGAAVLVLVLVLPGLGHRSPERESQSNNHPGISAKQQQHQHESGLPLAMLTAPMSTNISQKDLAWESERWNAFCQGFQYSNGYLTVPREGTYRVFLQMTHQNKENLCTEEDISVKELKTFTYMVVMFSHEYGETKLLSSRDTVACTSETWTRTLYASGLFHLTPNSRLRVNSSHPEIILRKEYLTFFGAELVL